MTSRLASATLAFPEIEEALQDLYDAGYNGYARQRETFFAAKYFPPIDLLMDAGYDVDFVKSYLVALGKAADSVENIDKLYVPKSSRPRTSAEDTRQPDPIETKCFKGLSDCRVPVM